MEKILIEATARTPKFDFDPEKRTLVLSGESYPEDPQKFFAAPLVKKNKEGVGRIESRKKKKREMLLVKPRKSRFRY